MCLPRIRVKIDLDEDRDNKYFSSSTSYSRKQSSSPSSSSMTSTSTSSSQIRHRQHRRQRHSSYDYASASRIDYEENHTIDNGRRYKPRSDYRTTAQNLMMREPPRKTRDWEPRNRPRQQLQAHLAHYPASRSHLRTTESRDTGRYVKSVEQRVVAENLVDVIEIAPKGAGGSSRREKRYTRYPEWRPQPDKGYYATREPRGWKKSGLYPG